MCTRTGQAIGPLAVQAIFLEISTSIRALQSGLRVHFKHGTLSVRQLLLDSI